MSILAPVKESSKDLNTRTRMFQPGAGSVTEMAARRPKLRLGSPLTLLALCATWGRQITPGVQCW